MWKRIEPIDGNGGGTNALVQLTYGLNGEQYPRLSLAVYADVLGKAQQNITVSCSTKQNVTDHWASQGVPRELIGALKELLDKAASTPYIDRPMKSVLKKR